MRNFDPWVGSQYQNGLNGVRVLILGESHYGTPPERSGFTSAIINKYGQTKRSRFFSTTQRLVSLDKNRGHIPSSERREFWDKVAFYNFVQEFVGTTSRLRPSQSQWERGAEPFIQTVTELAPQLIVVLGKKLKTYLPPEINGVVYAYVKHPSGNGFTYKQFQPIVAKAFEQCEVRT